MSESTPFLPTAHTSNLNPDSTFNTPPPANPPATKAFARLTNTSFFGSLTTLVLILAAYIACSVSPLYTWSIERDIGALAFFILLTALLSLLNRTSIRSSNTTPLTLNIVFDLFLACSICVAVLSLIGDTRQDLSYPRCGQDYSGPDDGKKRGCVEWLVVAGSLVGASLLGGLVVGISHLTLLVLRCMNAWRSRFWSRPFPWFVRAGQVVIEFNFRVLRPDGERTRDGNQGARLEESAEGERLVEV